jgi:hypothetical protein
MRRDGFAWNAETVRMVCELQNVGGVRTASREIALGEAASRIDCGEPEVGPGDA